MKQLLFILIILASAIGVSYPMEPVKIAVDRANPPFMYQIDEQAVGLYPTLLKAVFEQMNIPVSIRPLPWKRALILAERGEIGIAGIYKTEKRLKKYDYSDDIFQEKLFLFVLKGNEFPYTTARDLAGKKIGVIRAWSYGDEFDRLRREGLFAAEETSGDDQNFSKLLLKRIDCVLAIEETGLNVLDREMFKWKISKISTPVTVNPTYLVFSKKATAPDLLSRFNAALSEMKKNGQYRQLVRTFFSRH